MDDLQQRAIQARVLVQQPFWNELAAHAISLEANALSKLQDARHADPLVLKALHQRWLAIKDTVSAILQYPQGAIDAAKDATRPSSDWAVEGDTLQTEQ
jgi:hypothetical protein